MVSKHAKKQSHEPKKVEKNTKENYRYGPLPSFTNQRLWSRGIVLLGVFVYIWYFHKEGKETVLAGQKETFERRGLTFECDSAYRSEVNTYSNCMPSKCGRYVTDKLVTNHEVAKLLQMAKIGFSLGGSSGGASIMDIHSGALSYDDKFVDMKTVNGVERVFSPEFLLTYKIIIQKIQYAVAQTFGIESSHLYLTHPTFFSRLTNLEAKTRQDEYWHSHIDKVTYESFHYTALLYLSDFNIDFKGGRFIFEDKTSNMTVEPRMGRVSMFTSGAENTHRVEPVSSGVRFALTVPFTCDKSHAINVPLAIT